MADGKAAVWTRCPKCPARGPDAHGSPDFPRTTAGYQAALCALDQHLISDHDRPILVVAVDGRGRETGYIFACCPLCQPGRHATSDYVNEPKGYEHVLFALEQHFVQEHPEHAIIFIRD